LQIIQEALNRANRGDLLSEARLWLNLFLKSQYRNQDWPFALKEVTLPIVQGAAIPSDYARARDAKILDGATNQVPILFLTPEQYDAALRSGYSSSIPLKCYVDQYARTFHWVPPPNQTYSFILRYYFMPVLPDSYSPVGDLDVPLWTADVEVLIQAVYVRALQYDEDNRYDKEDAKLVKMIVDAKMNLPDFRAGTNRIKLGKNFRRRL